jgi:hypothetical protein
MPCSWSGAGDHEPVTTVVEVRPPDLAPLLEVLDPAGWVNLRPAIDPDDAPPDPSSGLFALFGARGPVVPLCTWNPGERSAGIEHGTGPKVARRLEIPPGWRVAQDHPRRGLVVVVPLGTGDDEALHWLIAAGTLLCPVPTTGTWVAEIRP